jgi:hypothetical protein
MKKLAIVFAVGAAALLGGSAAYASDNIAKTNIARTKAATDVTQPSTDISSRGRHYRHYGYRHYRHYGYRNYRPYYGNSYGYYAPRPYYGGYGYGGPGISFSFGTGGYRGW